MHFFVDAMVIDREPPPTPRKSRDSTDHTHTATGQPQVINDPIMTFSGRFKQPEIVLFAEPTKRHSRVLVMKVIVYSY